MTERNSPTKQRLLDEAIRLLDTHGPEALQARKVTAAACTSTMAVYTHFGGMRELVDEIAVEGFRLLTDALASVEPGEDPVADLAALALAYRSRALAAPHLYRLMFGLTATGGYRLPGTDLTSPSARTDASDRTGTSARTDASDRTGASADTGASAPTTEPFIGQEAFAHLVEATRRAIEAGRFRDEDPTHTAAQLWSALHGYVLLEMSGYFGEPDSAVEPILIPLLSGLVIGLGDTPAHAETSAAGFRTASGQPEQPVARHPRHGS
ncbi:TetR/AcrR family transcriptional regulator [Streptomyces sp. KLOTTS4A1]|uniref:TetR/AcrR family transcriptional regulator n=1 Tax=Streptomyces sp. KLOTTS4A1 TaxID=3390996 RepID=UPI0039F4EB59